MYKLFSSIFHKGAKLPDLFQFGIGVFFAVKMDGDAGRLMIFNSHKRVRGNI